MRLRVDKFKKRRKELERPNGREFKNAAILFGEKEFWKVND